MGVAQEASPGAEEEPKMTSADKNECDEAATRRANSRRAKQSAEPMVNEYDSSSRSDRRHMKHLTKANAASLATDTPFLAVESITLITA
jgi:hypothetical protein